MTAARARSPGRTSTGSGERAGRRGSAAPVRSGAFRRRVAHAGPSGPWRCRHCERLGGQGRQRPARGERAGTGQVDRVVALVHARRLEDVRGVGERRMPEQVGQARRADPPGAQVLVTVRPRPELGARVVEMDHDQPLEPDPLVEGGQEASIAAGVGDVDAGAPGVRGVEAEADSLGVDAARRDRRGDAPPARRRSCPARRRCRPSSRARACGRVRARRRPRRALSRMPVGRRRRDRRRRRRCPAVRTDVDVDEPRPERRRAAQLVGEHVDRAREDSGFGPARFTRYEAWIETGRDVELAEPRRGTRRTRRGGSARRRQAVGLSAEDLHRVAPISWARSTALTIPVAEGQVGTESSAIGEHRTHRTMAPMDADEAEDPPSKPG